MIFSVIKPYLLLARLDKPIGSVLLLFPCWWGVVYVQKLQFSLKLLFLFFLGALVMRSAGCIFNDLCDQDFDRQVVRTQKRPLVMGTVQKLPTLLFFFFLCMAGLLVLLQLPQPCWLIGMMGFILLFIYPFMKRFTSFPQVGLGFAFNLGFMMGVVAATQDIKTLLRLPVLLIYLGAILWTVGYDTIYAVQDRADDAKLGIFSTALLFGQKTREITLSLYLSSGGLILLGALLEGMSFFSYPVIIMSYLWMSYQLWILNLEEREACRDFFIKNQWVGTSIFLAFML